jgi:hypothetical protein
MLLLLISRVQHRCEDWAGKHLSPVDRVVLSNTVLNAILMLYMQTFLLPAWVTKTLTTITRKFIWRGSPTNS